MQPFQPNPHDFGPCEGCGNSATDRQERCGEMLCRSCFLLNEHMEEDPKCEGCNNVKVYCKFRDGDA